MDAGPPTPRVTPLWLTYLSFPAARSEVVLKIRRRGAIEEFSATPYMVSALQCGMWSVYAIVTPCKLQPFVTNIVGVGLELVYVAFFLSYATGAALRRVALQFAGCVVFFVVLVVFGVVIAPHLPISPFPVQTPPLSKATTVLGFICAGLNILSAPCRAPPCHSPRTSALLPRHTQIASSPLLDHVFRSVLAPLSFPLLICIVLSAQCATQRPPATLAQCTRHHSQLCGLSFAPSQ